MQGESLEALTLTPRGAPSSVKTHPKAMGAPHSSQLRIPMLFQGARAGLRGYLHLPHSLLLASPGRGCPNQGQCNCHGCSHQGGLSVVSPTRVVSSAMPWTGTPTKHIPRHCPSLDTKAARFSQTPLYLSGKGWTTPCPRHLTLVELPGDLGHVLARRR